MKAPAPLPGRPTSGVRSCALFVFLVALCFYGLQFPERMYGDDVYFVQCVVRDFPYAPHFLFLPTLRASSWLLAHVGVDPFTTLRLLSALGVAAGGAFLFLAARARNQSSRAALVFAALPLTAASTLFFATAAEVHGLHFGAVSLGLFLLARLRPEARVRDVFLAALSFGLIVGTHQSGVLMIFGLIAAYFAATPGRQAALRLRDAFALGLAGAISIGLMFFFRYVETGAAFTSEDSPSWFVEGIRAKLARGYGWREMVTLLSGDAFGAALPLTLAAGVAAGALARRDTRRFALLASVLIPYFLFFPLFGYIEHGAYYLVTLPLYAAALLYVAASQRIVLWIAAALALVGWVTPEQWSAALGPYGPSLCFLVALGIGIAVAGNTIGIRPPAAIRWALGPLVLLALLQLSGAVRSLSAYDSKTPLQDWLRGACRANQGRDTYLIVADFQRNWSLRLVDEEWPEPWAGTWDLLDEVPIPGPHGFVYGDPGLPSPLFHAQVAELLAQGTEIWIDPSVRTFVELQPQHAADLEFLEAKYDLYTVESGAFRAERLMPKSP